MERLRRLAAAVFAKEGLTVGVTCDRAGFELLSKELPSYVGKLSGVKESRPLAALSCDKKNEGFMDASKVQYVARAGNFRQAGFSYTGALKILKVILSYDYLWLNVRVKGGAYGCGGTFARSGNAYFASYRDPNLGATNEVYERMPEYIRNFTADERDMTKYIIGTVSDLDVPLTPSAKGLRSIATYFSRIDEEDIQKERDEILCASCEDIRGLADLVEAVLSQGNLCVIGNEDRIEEEKELFIKTEQLL